MLVITATKAAYFSRLSADDLFGDLPPKSAELFNAARQPGRFRKNAVIYQAGAMPSGFYLLRKGRIRLRRPAAATNEENTEHVIAPDEIFGLTETISGVPYEASSEVLTPCRCDFIGREDFFRFLQFEPETSLCLSRRLALNLQKNLTLLL